MITIVLTNRNRDLKLVEQCIASLSTQVNRDFKLVVVDYGSRTDYLKDFKELISQYQIDQFLSCDTSGQLWCKSRAINIILKQCKTSHFFVGDIDMIYHPEFTEKLHQIKTKADATYFQVGFLSEAESKKNKAFNDYEINFKSNHEATGMTLFNTKVLLDVNGYDEFYHGWGSEDTDVHARLKNANKHVVYYDENILMLHQWHPKTYRSKDSLEPFHSHLEKINHKYLYYTTSNKKTKANANFDFGVYAEEDYKKLNSIDAEFSITNELSDFKGFISNVLLNGSGKVISCSVKKHPEYKSLKQVAKQVLGKKAKTFLDIQMVNDLLLEHIIMNFRNAPYKYTFDTNSQTISLIIKL